MKARTNKLIYLLMYISVHDLVAGSTMEGRIEILQGDITRQRVDAIVNAANRSLLGGGGVDGAIHRAAGPELLEECKSLGGCETGEAKITGGHNLPAKHVIHTVGPVWSGGDNREDEKLANCYRNSLKVAVKNRVRTIAFPSISTGAYGFPVDRAARIAIGEIRAFLSGDETVQKVYVVAFDGTTYKEYSDALKE
jgi:O-acetyl-ADP-ribose deacetylase (regulator of RNase III)